MAPASATVSRVTVLALIVIVSQIGVFLLLPGALMSGNSSETADTCLLKVPPSVADKRHPAMSPVQEQLHDAGSGTTERGGGANSANSLPSSSSSSVLTSAAHDLSLREGVSVAPAADAAADQAHQLPGSTAPIAATATPAAIKTSSSSSSSSSSPPKEYSFFHFDHSYTIFGTAPNISAVGDDTTEAFCECYDDSCTLHVANVEFKIISEGVVLLRTTHGKTPALLSVLHRCKNNFKFCDPSPRLREKGEIAVDWSVLCDPGVTFKVSSKTLDSRVKARIRDSGHVLLTARANSGQFYHGIVYPRGILLNWAIRELALDLLAGGRDRRTLLLSGTPMAAPPSSGGGGEETPSSTNNVTASDEVFANASTTAAAAAPASPLHPSRMILFADQMLRSDVQKQARQVKFESVEKVQSLLGVHTDPKYLQKNTLMTARWLTVANRILKLDGRLLAKMGEAVEIVRASAQGAPSVGHPDHGKAGDPAAAATTTVNTTTTSSDVPAAGSATPVADAGGGSGSGSAAGAALSPASTSGANESVGTKLRANTSDVTATNATTGPASGSVDLLADSGGSGGNENASDGMASAAAAGSAAGAAVLPQLPLSAAAQAPDTSGGPCCLKEFGPTNLHELRGGKVAMLFTNRKRQEHHARPRGIHPRHMHQLIPNLPRVTGLTIDLLHGPALQTFSGLLFEQQLAIVSNYSFFFSDEGAQLTWMIFANPGSTWVTMFDFKPGKFTNNLRYHFMTWLVRRNCRFVAYVVEDDDEAGLAMLYDVLDKHRPYRHEIVYISPKREVVRCDSLETCANRVFASLYVDYRAAYPLGV